MGPKLAKAGQSLPVVPKITQSETIQSLNYLYQSAIYAALHAALQGKTPFTSSYQRGLQLQALAKKATLRLDPSIKRSFCRRCNTPLLAGFTCSIRCVTFPPSSRAIETRCLACSHRMRQCMPPSKPINHNTIAKRHRKVQQRKGERLLQAKVLKYTRESISKSGTNNKEQASTKSRGRQQPESRGKWSQRARRRAGRAKAIALRRDGVAVPKIGQPSEKRDRGSASTLPRYAGRTPAQDSTWDSSWPQETTAAEREAIRVLRGNHIVTSGVARGGAVGRRAM